MASFNHELALISAIRVHGPEAFREKIKISEAFSEDLYKVVDDFENHRRQHGCMPSAKTCSEIYGYTIDDSHADEPPSFYMDLIENSYIQTQVKESLLKVQGQSMSDPTGATYTGGSLFRDLSLKLATSSGLFVDACDYDAHADYIRNLLTEKPVKTICPELDDRLSGGYRPGELIAIAARPGEGKTWVLLMNAIRAWQGKSRVAFVTTEMSDAEIRLRSICLSMGFPIAQISTVILSYHDDVAAKARKKWKQEGIHDSFKILTEDNQAVEDVESRVLSFKPDIVFIDGFYLLKTYESEREKHNRIGNVVNRLKRFARANNICVVIATQLNRGVASSKKRTTRDLGDLSFSDEIGMVCDHVVFISRGKEEARAEVMKFEIPKGRRLSNADDFYMDFSLARPRESFFPVDKLTYDKRVKQAKDDMAKAESQDSEGDYANFSKRDGMGSSSSGSSKSVGALNNSFRDA